MVDKVRLQKPSIKYQEWGIVNNVTYIVIILVDEIKLNCKRKHSIYLLLTFDSSLQITGMVSFVIVLGQHFTTSPQDNRWNPCTK